MKKLALIAAVMITLITISSVTAQPGRNKRPDRPKGFNIDRLTKALELTDAQAAQILTKPSLHMCGENMDL